MLMRLIKHIANRINRCNIFIALCIQTLYLSIVLNIDDTLSTCMAAEKDSFVRFRHTQHIDDIVLTSVAISSMLSTSVWLQTNAGHTRSKSGYSPFN